MRQQLDGRRIRAESDCYSYADLFVTGALAAVGAEVGNVE
jgi:hypothetical protein